MTSLKEHEGLTENLRWPLILASIRISELRLFKNEMAPWCLVEEWLNEITAQHPDGVDINELECGFELDQRVAELLNYSSTAMHKLLKRLGREYGLALGPDLMYYKLKSKN